jgi:hypothetical protein
MTRLEDLTPNAAIRGIIPDQTVTVVNTQWFGSEALELTYKDPSGKVGQRVALSLRRATYRAGRVRPPVEL